MTGLSTLLVELDDPAASGAWPYDITSYVDLREGWSVRRGRQDEFGDVEPGVAQLVLNNRDGRFTLGSSMYGGLVVDQRIRITETMLARNLLPNSGYETAEGAPDASGWSFEGASLSTVAFQGTTSVLLDNTAGGPGTRAITFRDLGGLVAGRAYTISVWVRAETTGVQLFVHDGTGANLRAVDVAPGQVGTGGFVRLVIAGWVATSSGAIRVHLQVGPAGKAYVDAWQVEAGQQATDWHRSDLTVTSRRLTGYVQAWPVSFADAGARNVPCRVQVVDRLSRLNRRKLAGIADAYRLDSAAFVYLLDEATTTTSFGDTSGNLRVSLTAAGTGAKFTAGTSLGGDLGGVTFVGGQFLNAKAKAAPVRTVEALVRVQAVLPAVQFLVALGNDDGSYLRVGVSGSDSGTPGQVFVQADVFGSGLGGFQFDGPVITDGKVHAVAATWRPNGASGQIVLYLDGVVVAGGTVQIAPPDWQALAVGGTATIAAVGGYGTALTDQQVSDHAAYVILTERSDLRVARLLRRAGVAAADMVLQQGVVQVVPQSLTGRSVTDGLGEVMATEGGALFVRGDGRVVTQNRTYRTYAASQTPVVELVSSDVDHDQFEIVTDKQYLQNEVTGSRVDGATQTARNVASIGIYEQYPGDVSGLLVTTDDQVQDRVSWQVGAYAQPLPRVNSVVIDLLTLASTAKVQALLALEIGDRITIAGLPSQSPVAVADLIVEGLEESQQADKWQLTLNTVSAALFRAWIVGSATYGVLGSTTRLHF